MTGMMVIVEHAGGQPRKVSLELLGRGRELGVPTQAVVLAASAEPVLVALGGAAGQVLAVEDARFESYAAEDTVTALAQLIGQFQPSLVVAGATANGRDFMPRLAARLGAGYAASCVALDGDGASWTVRRPVQGGKAYVELTASASPVLATVRPNAYAAAEGGAAPEVQRVTPAFDAPARTANQGFEPTGGGRVPVEEAAVVVCGGRGFGSAEQFTQLEALADALGGAVGASRAVVDAQVRPVDEQVGKSGKTIAPRLYFAIGVSGAIHHTMGMDTSGTVVAINSDPNAIIFQYADYGLVGDASQIVPALTERLR